MVVFISLQVPTTTPTLAASATNVGGLLQSHQYEFFGAKEQGKISIERDRAGEKVRNVRRGHEAWLLKLREEYCMMTRTQQVFIRVFAFMSDGNREGSRMAVSIARVGNC